MRRTSNLIRSRAATVHLLAALRRRLTRAAAAWDFLLAGWPARLERLGLWGRAAAGRRPARLELVPLEARFMPARTDVLVSPSTAAAQWSSVAMDPDGDSVIVWYNTLGIWARLYGPDGAPKGSTFQVATDNTGIGLYTWPSVAMAADGGFVVVWETLDPARGNIYISAREYAANGTPDGGAFQVNTSTTNYQINPVVAADAGGDFVVAWTSADSDSSNTGVLAQRFAAGGSPQGSEFLVNSYPTGAQRNPAVAMDADGDFVIAWVSYGQDGGQPWSPYGSFAQRFAADGTPQGSEFRVNTSTNYDELVRSVAMDEDGDFIIAWTSYDPGGAGGQDGSGGGVYAQRYTAGGTPQGSEFRLNTYTTGAQYSPWVAMDADGNFIATWESYAQDGN